MPTAASDPLFGALTQAQVRRLFACLAEGIDPKPELHFRTPFELLIAVVLSAQATDRSVNAATGPLFAAAATPAALHALGVAGLIPYIRHIGLFNTKARHIIALCRILLEEHAGQVPDSQTALEALPGVGRKTANVVRNIAFGADTIAVDTHVHRVANRTGIANTRTPSQTERVLLARTPRQHRHHAHHYLILHGRYVCTARKPHCADCALKRLCRFRADPA